MFNNFEVFNENVIFHLQILNERIESAKVLMKPKYANGTTKLNEMVRFLSYYFPLNSLGILVPDDKETFRFFLYDRRSCFFQNPLNVEKMPSVKF